MSRGRGERRRAGCSAALYSFSGWVRGVGVSVDGAVSLICAGWLPQDGASKGALPRV